MKLSRREIENAFRSETGQQYGPVLTARQLAQLLTVSVKTLYQWVAAGRLDGAFRKRGKHLLFWRDRALEILFNSSDWK